MQKNVLVLIDGCNTAGLILAWQFASAGTRCVIGCPSTQSVPIRQLIRSLKWDDAIVIELPQDAGLYDAIKELLQVVIGEFGKLDAIVYSFNALASALRTSDAAVALRAQAGLYGIAAALAYLPNCGPGKIVGLIIEQSYDAIMSSPLAYTSMQHVCEELRCYGIEATCIRVTCSDKPYPAQKTILNARVPRDSEVIMPLLQGCMRAVMIALESLVGVR